MAITGTALLPLLPLLAACGGGSDSSANTAPGVQTTSTMSAYLVQRSQVASVQGGVLPSAAQIDAERAANHQQAATHLAAALTVAGNAATAPPLADAALRVLQLASQGQSLAQLPALASNDWTRAWQTNQVHAAVWIDRGRALETQFLASTDLIGHAWPPLAAWTGAEAGFSAGTALGDGALTTALQSAHPDLTTLMLSDVDRVRALVAQSLDLSPALAGGTSGTGVFQHGVDNLGNPVQLTVPVTRSQLNVTGMRGSDYAAQLQTGGTLRLLKITPTGDNVTPSAFASSGRLAAALGESVAALVLSRTGGSPDEMVLPTGSWHLGFNAKAALTQRGVTQVFDKLQADLRGVSASGGLYLQMPSPTVRLSVGATSMRWQAAQMLAFTFDPQNPNANSGYGSASGFVLTPSAWLGNCSWPAADLRPFFLALVDDRGRVHMLMAMSELEGTEVIPACT